MLFFFQICSKKKPDLEKLTTRIATRTMRGTQPKQNSDSSVAILQCGEVQSNHFIFLNCEHIYQITFNIRKNYENKFSTIIFRSF